MIMLWFEFNFGLLIGFKPACFLLPLFHIILYVMNYKHLKPNINLNHSNITSLMVNFIFQIFNNIDLMAHVAYLHNQSKINEDHSIRAIFLLDSIFKNNTYLQWEKQWFCYPKWFMDMFQGN